MDSPPSISATGTGRSIYYSGWELVKLAAMEYCLYLRVLLWQWSKRL
ncbi:hypothetical protein PL8927_610035 [Planktothrix serta PCC 8927]|uniref:Uncharacterized protein n=1 Tax=Planktothrix serta PCC 8927 TaxID=671068 RepID=A0A7Z9BQZ2_9CYAN|nr:hypothetical protein [Planktothrix serta]VXD18831.1 hypothetical protein PL8927_610035 [Planktothrix serta PCC 8927]